MLSSALWNKHFVSGMHQWARRHTTYAYWASSSEPVLEFQLKFAGGVSVAGCKQESYKFCVLIIERLLKPCLTLCLSSLEHTVHLVNSRTVTMILLEV